MAAGSFCWGLIAQRTGLTTALLIGAAALAVASLGLYRVRLPKGESDLEPSHHWPEPLIAAPIERDRGPVLVQIEYRIAREQRESFLQLLERLSEARRRDGAYLWCVSEDAADPERIVEWFLVESWAEHLRQHRRVTHADADLQQEVVAFHRGAEPAIVRHLLNIRSGRTPPHAAL